MQGRTSGIELLRLILMLMIVVHHGIVHGLGMTGLSEPQGDCAIRPDDMLLLSAANCLCIPAVNVFLLISGFFGIKPTAGKVIKLITAMVLYTLVFTVCYYLYLGDWHHALSNLLLFSHSKYWFLVDYLFLLCFTPLLNGMFEMQSRRFTTAFIICLLIISSYFGFVWGNSANVNGYTLMQFIMMYCIGRYIKTYDIRLRKTRAVLIYISCVVICSAGMYLMYRLGLDRLAWKLTYYNNPLIIIAAIAAFQLFRGFDFSSRVVNRLALSSLAIYLFQSSKFVEDVYYGVVRSCYTRLEALSSSSVSPALASGGGYFIDNHYFIVGYSRCGNICRPNTD